MLESLFYRFQDWRPPTLLKKRLAQVLSCKFREIFNNTFFTEHLRVTASVRSYSWLYLNRALNLKGTRVVGCLYSHMDEKVNERKKKTHNRQNLCTHMDEKVNVRKKHTTSKMFMRKKRALCKPKRWFPEWTLLS